MAQVHQLVPDGPFDPQHAPRIKNFNLVLSYPFQKLFREDVNHKMHLFSKNPRDDQNPIFHSLPEANRLVDPVVWLIYLPDLHLGEGI